MKNIVNRNTSWRTSVSNYGDIGSSMLKPDRFSFGKQAWVFKKLEPLLTFIRYAIVLTISLSFLQIGCGSSHKFHDQALQAIKVVLPLLEKYGVCLSEQDCQQKEVVLFEAGDAVRLNIYRFPRSDELRPAIVEELCRLKKENPKVLYVLTTYSNAHSEKNVNQVQIKIEGVC